MPTSDRHRYSAIPLLGGLCQGGSSVLRTQEQQWLFRNRRIIALLMDALFVLSGCSGCGGAGRGEEAERHMTVPITSELCMPWPGAPTAAPVPSPA